MTRTSKQGQMRNQSPRRPRLGGVKTGPKKDLLKHGYKPHKNLSTLENRFIPVI